jgi:4-amino-4-deoxy-L-arabinose transferase-like glycosyltransferase
MLFARRAATSLLLIMAITAIVRIAFAWEEERRIPREELSAAVFQTEAANIGRSLALGKGFSSPYARDTGPTAILPPVYPLLVAGVFRVFGIATAGAFRALVLLNIVFATLTCLPLYRVGEHLGGVGLASGAAWMWAVFPNGVMIPFEWIWETSLSALLAATLLWLTLKLEGSARAREWALYGLLWGLALMTNPALGAALPALLGWAAWRAARAHRPAMQAAGRPALAVAVAILCCVPWTLRNFSRFHRFIPLRSGFGFELYIGNNENYDPRRVVWPPPVTYQRELVRYIHMGEMPFMDEEKRKALAFIAAHPRVTCALIGKRVIEFWSGTAAPLAAFESQESALERFLLICNVLLPALVALGAVFLLLRRRELGVPLLAFPTLYPVIYYVTHASLRYRHAIDPNLCVLGALAIAGLAPRVRRPERAALPQEVA